MFIKILVTSLTFFSQTSFATHLIGAGASFPYPVYSKWNTHFYKEKKIKIDYQSIGSGSGLNQIKAQELDFAGTDEPLTKEELDKAQLIQIPMLVGGIVLSYNLNSEKILALDANIISSIYLGSLTEWDDNYLMNLNPDIKFPKSPIKSVARIDSSGTTYIFTNYLSKIDKNWKKKYGASKSLNWPVSTGVMGNEGVSNFITLNEGAIGYTSYATATQLGLSVAKMKNSAGDIVKASEESFSLAVENSHLSSKHGYHGNITNNNHKGAWPLTGITYFLIHKKITPERYKKFINYIQWCYLNGDASARELGYVPLPNALKKDVMFYLTQKVSLEES